LQVPSHLPLIATSHEPWHVPSHLAAALISQWPSHFALHVPESLPGSHSTFAEPGLTFASHFAAQSAIALIEASRCGGTMPRPIWAFAPISAFASPIALTASLHASSPVLGSPWAPRSFARPPQPVLRSASILSAKPFSSSAATRPCLSFMPAAASI